MLNWFEKWILKGIAKKLVKQGGQDLKVQTYYSYIISAAKNEYIEDNDTSLRSYLEEMHSIECNKQFEYAQRKIEDLEEMHSIECNKQFGYAQRKIEDLGENNE
jgi:hypothetical protein